MTLSTSKTTWRADRAALRQVHRTLRRRIREIQLEADDAFARGFGQLVATVEAGVRHEEVLLEALAPQHLYERRAENAFILCALHKIASTVEQGQVEPGRQLAAALEEMLALDRLSPLLTPAISPGSALPRVRRVGKGPKAIPGRTGPSR